MGEGQGAATAAGAAVSRTRGGRVRRTGNFGRTIGTGLVEPTPRVSNEGAGAQKLAVEGM